MLQRAEQRLRRLGIDGSDLHLGNCIATNFDPASFDVIVCLGVVSYVEDYARVFAEVQRLLKPGGHAIISFRNKFGPILWDPVKALKWFVKSAIGRTAPEPFRVARFMDHREVRAVAADHGFEQRGFIGLGYGPIRLNGRSVLPEAASIRLSGALARLIAKFDDSDRLARWLADVSFWVWSKPLDAAVPHSDPVRDVLPRSAA
jgi:SAM-dependent methyltransferase